MARIAGKALLFQSPMPLWIIEQTLLNKNIDVCEAILTDYFTNYDK